MGTQSKEAEEMSELERIGNDLPEIDTTPNLIAEFQKALIHMDDFRQDLADTGNWEALAHGLTQLSEFKKNLSMLIESIELDINKLLPEKKVIMEGLGIIEKRTSTSKKWESERLLDNIVRRCLDNGTGEITPADVMHLVETLKRVLPLTASLGWRSTELELHGFDPKDFSDTVFGRKTVTIKKK
jgi:hypothetical protein